jgi:hypothetical protein
MNRHDFEFEEFIVAVAVSLPLHGFDFVVGALQWAG